MFLPCDTCKFKKETKIGFRIFVGCKDKEKEEKNFHEDNYFYHHLCDAYEEESENK